MVGLCFFYLFQWPITGEMLTVYIEMFQTLLVLYNFKPSRTVSQLYQKDSVNTSTSELPTVTGMLVGL